MSDQGCGRGGRGAALLKALQAANRAPGQQEGAAAAQPPSASAAPPGAPGGRGALLQQMLRQSAGATAGPSGDAPARPAGRGAPMAAPAAMGRAALLKSMISKQPQQPTGTTTASALIDVPSTTAAAIATLRQQPVVETARPSAATADAPAEGEGGRRFPTRMERMLERMSLRQDPIRRVGEVGIAKSLSANYVRIRCKNEGVFQYSVAFSPNIDSPNMRRKLINSCEDVLGEVRSFDGAILFLPVKLPQRETICQGTLPTDGTNVTVFVTLVKVLPAEQCVQLYNIVFKEVLRKLKLVQVGRHYYDPNGSISVPQHRLEIWPGYVTAITEFEGGLMLVLDISHRVLRTDTVLDVMKDIQRRSRDSFQEEVVKKIVGTSVLTRYNNKTYRVDDIDWRTTPNSSFQLSTGETISYLEYYKKSYGRDIKDRGQPILVHKPKPPRGQAPARAAQKPEMISLIPELCYTTGLTDDMRSDFRVMKDLAAHTRVSPEGRQRTMRSFIHRVTQEKEAKVELDKWGLELEPDVIPIEGRQLPIEKIMTARQTNSAGQEADWGRVITRDSVICAKPLNQWIIIYTLRDKGKVNDYIQSMKQHSGPMGMRVAEPRTVELNNDRTETYLVALKNNVTKETDLVVTIFPTSRDDRYNAVKKYCYVEFPVASQCINLKTIGVKEKLRSVVQKILLQINCKLGGTLWGVDIPMKNIMVVGIDVYHDGKGRNAKSVGGLVASINGSCTAWYSRVAFQEPGQEIMDTLRVALAQSVKKFHQVNHALPQTIVIYRDGVGDGALKFVQTHEVTQLKQTFKTFGEDYNPKFAMLIVQKRINTRIFGRNDRDQLSNPAPGTVLDHSVTRRDLFDFFLVSQHVRQGTVTPTHYIVADEVGNWKVDHIQRLTYKMTHLYYNWPGTIRVPAPCQYAHKLAQMVGMNLRKVPAESLCERLFYL